MTLAPGAEDADFGLELPQIVQQSGSNSDLPFGPSRHDAGVAVRAGQRCGRGCVRDAEDSQVRKSRAV